MIRAQDYCCLSLKLPALSSSLRGSYKSRYQRLGSATTAILDGRISARLTPGLGAKPHARPPLSLGLSDGHVDMDKVHAMPFWVLTDRSLVGPVIAIDDRPTFLERTVRRERSEKRALRP